MENHITEHGFKSVRESLRYSPHSFEPHELDKMQAVYEVGVEHAKKLTGLRDPGLRARDYADVMKHVREETPEGKSLSSRHWSALDTALKAHLGIAEEETKH